MTTVQFIQRRWPGSRWQFEFHSEHPDVVTKCRAAAVAGLACLHLLPLHPPNTQYSYKPLALLTSQFRHVLYLDVDSIPAVDPLRLFTDPEYATLGAMFWPDLWGVAGRNFSFTDETGDPFQTGQTA